MPRPHMDPGGCSARSDGVEIELATWLAARFLEEEKAMLAEVQLQWRERHSALQKEIMDSFSGTGLTFSKNTESVPRQRAVGEKPSLEEQAKLPTAHPSENCQIQKLMSSTVESRKSSKEQSVESLLFESVRDSDMVSVKRLLEQRGNPNITKNEFQFHGRSYTPCSLLSVAVVNGEIDMAETLIRSSANPDSMYGFAAGAQRMQWSGPCAAAAIAKDNLDLLRLLIESRADPHAVGSNNATLTWQCAYFGRDDMMSYLMSLKGTVETPAGHPDLVGVSHTPLHVAVLRGHKGAVSILLASKASTVRKNEIKMTALDDAIITCQPNLILLLVGKGADLFDDLEEQKRQKSFLSAERVNLFTQKKSNSLLSHSELAPITRAIEFANPVVMNALAAGLAQREDQVRLLKIPQIIEFLKAPGDAPAKMLDAMFRNRSIAYWEQNDKSFARKQVTTAFIPKPELLPNGRLLEKMHVAAMSMSFRDLVAKLEAKLPLEQQEVQQVEALAPQEWNSNYLSGDALICSVNLYECLVSNVHRDLGVIAAIAHLDNRTLSMRPCQAILQKCWKSVKRQSFFDVCVHGMLMIDFIIIGLFLQYSKSASREERLVYDSNMRVVAGIGLVFSVTHLVFELLQLIAFYIQGWLGMYFSDLGNYVDMARIAGDNFVLMYVFIYGSAVGDADSRRAQLTLSLCAFYKWIKFMAALTPFRRFGPSILPILEAVYSAGPFFVVLSFCIFGLCHAYVTLEPGRLEIFQSWFMIYRLSLFGEWEPYESDDTSEDQDYLFHMFYMGAALMVTITLMNVFIAALSTSFTIATDNMIPLFERRRAMAILSNMAVREGIKDLCPSRRDETHDCNDDILWFCCAAPDALADQPTC